MQRSVKETNLHKTENSSTYPNYVIQSTNINVNFREKSCMELEWRNIAQDQNAWMDLRLKWLCCSLNESVWLCFLVAGTVYTPNL